MDKMLEIQNFNIIDVLEKRPNCSTYLSKLQSDSTYCVIKSINENNIQQTDFIQYVHNLQHLTHQGLIPFIGYHAENGKSDQMYYLIYQYAKNKSLKNIFDLRAKQEIPQWFDITRQFIIIYGMAYTLNYLHEHHIIHGRLTPTNILLNEEFEPQISDFGFNNLISKQSYTIEEMKKFNLFYYLDPLSLQNQEKSEKTDVYAFAMITIQILSGTIHVFENEEDTEVSIIIDKIKEGNLKPMIPLNLPEELKNILINCLDKDLDNRPNFQTICTKLDAIISSLHGIRKDTFNQYKAKIESNLIEKKENTIILEEEDWEIEYENDESSSEKSKFTRLAFNSYFEEQKNINDIIASALVDIRRPDLFNYDIKDLKHLNFVFTDGAKERLMKIINYLKVKVPVLLEGPTGTSKTLSCEIVSELLGLDLIRFNLSSETKTQDLIGRFVGDPNSWAGISMIDGPFYVAYSKGKILLLDEINLASASVLQCIEEAIDSRHLSVEIPGRPLKVVEMHENFHLIATQNPNKGLYANKRQKLGFKFYSRFQIINFPEFTKNELLEIANGLAKSFEYKNPKVIQELVDFHINWKEKHERPDDPQCFTVREIAATIDAIRRKKCGIYDTIMTIYGARYQKDVRKELQKELNNYVNLIDNSQRSLIPKFPGCYVNQSLITAIKSIKLSLDNHRNVIITGKDGCGKTQLALWYSDHYNRQIDIKKKNSKDEKQSFFCVCTEEIKVSDLIGRQSPSGTSDGINEVIVWRDGFLTKAIKQGKCSVLESIDEAPPTVTDRLNGLLDQKYDNQDRFFDIPESSTNQKVLIEDSFRILATCNIDKLYKMSPAFLNRFDIIVLENQIDDNIDTDSFKKLLSILLERYLEKQKIEQNKEVNSPNNNDEKVNKTDDENEEDSLEDQCEYEYDDDNAQSETKLQREINKECLISCMYETLKHERDISLISKVCNAVAKFSSVFMPINDITEQMIVDLSLNLLRNNSNYKIPDLIKNQLLKMLKEIRNNIDDPFFYKDSNELKLFFAELMAYSLIEQPVIISGPPGIGKTSGARAFAMKRPSKSEFNHGFQMHSFHLGTKVSHFFGTTILRDGKIEFHDGTLTKSLKEGLVFIADEFNLSSRTVMKSLALALDPTIGKNVYIPCIGEFINISSEFHFIACQNKIGTLGRNTIPESILKRFISIEYPIPNDEDIKNICIKIAQEIAKKNRFQKFNEEDEILAKRIGNYMIILNNKEINYVPRWSLRDVTKLFRRIFNSHTSNKFINFEPPHHILFYTMASIPTNKADSILETICSIIKQIFEEEDSYADYLNKCYTSEPKIKEVENQGYYIMKNDCGISMRNIKNSLYSKNLPSLLNAVFQVVLSDNKEPILLMGNSGFKTFLASNFLDSFQIIPVNQETDIGQLLGTSGFMVDSEEKLFYIDCITKIARQSLRKFELCEKLKSNELEKQDINDIIINGKRLGIPSSFYYALDHLSDKLFAVKENSDKDSFLSKITLEFRPGLILNAILQGKSLIIKNISNLPTVVFERFNELLSGRQNITLSEDIHNTFTSSEKKELTDFSSSLRVFATCSSNSLSNLSETVLSRFTVIFVQEYNKKEQEIVLQSYTQNSSLFNSNSIHELIEFAKNKNSFSFPQMIKAIEMTIEMNRITSLEEQSRNLGIVLYRIIGGKIESAKMKNLLYEEIQKHSFELPNSYQNLKSGECQLVVSKKDGFKGVKSKMSQLFLENYYIQEPKSNVAFTASFNDLLDVIHLGLAIHNPIILEGPPGQGKHTAINYVAEMLGIEVIHIMISQTTKVVDLFGKEMIFRKNGEIRINTVETKFVQIIKSIGNEKKSLIVLENLNEASPALLNALNPIFDTSSTTILLPNGNTIDRGIFDIIGIVNNQCTYKFPSSLIISSIYHIIPKLYPPEAFEIISTKFSKAGLKNENIPFSEIFYKATNNSLIDSNSSEVFSLNDIDKYIIMRSVTKNCLDESTILQMLFGYRFTNNDMIQKVLQSLKLKQMTFNPIFSYNISPCELVIRLHSNSKSFLSIPSNSNNVSTLSKINSLTLPQKHCLTFLAISVLSKRATVIQGDTASGKSRLIRLFSKLLGQKLITFQMTRDCNISILAGQSVLNDSLSPTDIQSMTKVFNEMSKIISIRQIIKKCINISKPSTWTPKGIKKILKKMKEIEPIYKETIYWPEIEKNIITIKELMSPINQFQHQKSEFINAMINGYWILIDGIESSPSIIAEKISSLCDEKPELNLYEYGPEFYFSINSKSKDTKIHENFHLFITYNPRSMKGFQMIDQMFLSKSLTFSLPPFDETTENSAQMLFGSLLKKNYSKDLSREIAARFASLHSFAKSVSQKNPEFFAGENQYNGRTLKFITKAFSMKEQNLSYIIRFSILNFYLNSYENQEKKKTFFSNLIEKILVKPDIKLLNQLQIIDSTFHERNKPALIFLRNIQRYILLNENNSFYFTEFIENCFCIKISDLKLVEDHIKDTIQLIKGNINIKNNYFAKFGILIPISSIFESILSSSQKFSNEQSVLSLGDEELENIEIISIAMSKLNLLHDLLRKELFSEQSSILLGNDKYSECIDIILKIVKDKNKNSFAHLFNYIKNNPNNISFIESIFPYYHFNDTNFCMISLWLPIMKTMIEKNVYFSIEIDRQIIEFNTSSPNGFGMILVLNEDKSLSISVESKIRTASFKKKNFPIISDKKKKIYNDDETKFDIELRKYNINNIRFNYIISELLNYQIQEVNGNRVNEALDCCKSLIKNKSLEIPIKYNKLSLCDLCSKTHTSIINIIWNVIFTSSKHEVKKLSLLLNPFESELLLSSLKMYNLVEKINVSDIIEWSYWVRSLEQVEEPILFCLLNFNIDDDRVYQNDIDKAIKDIKYSINILEKAPKKLEKIWSSNKFINKCQNKLQELIKIKSCSTKVEGETKQFKQLINELNSFENSKEFDEIKQQIRDYLTSINEFTHEKYEIARQIVNKFKQDVISINNVKDGIYINWPQIEIFYSDNKNSSKISLLTTLMWYSKIDLILNELSKNKDMISNLQKLGEFQEMKYVSQILLTSLIHYSTIDKSGLTQTEKNKSYYTLQAHMIAKLYMIDNSFIKNPAKIYSIINNYSKRDFCSMEEQRCIYEMIQRSGPNFTIKMPKFDPNSLVFLIVNEKTDSEFIPGPLFDLNDRIDMVFLKDQSILMNNHDLDSFERTAYLIAKIAFKYLFTDRDQIPENISEMKDAFKKNNITEQSKKNLISKIKILFKIADSLSNWAQKELFFDDLVYLSQNWIEKHELLNQYPSLFYWFCKNKQCRDQLIHLYEEYKPIPNEIPLWVICLRMMSSMQCIRFETKSCTEVSQIINSSTTKAIIKYFEKSRKDNKSIKYDWVNILISDLQPQITNNYVKIIHDFLYHLSFDEGPYNNDQIKILKHKCIKKSVKKITKLILNEQYKELINENFSNRDLPMYFLVYPLKSIHNYIDKIIDEKANLVLNNDITINLIQILNMKQIDTIISDLSSAIENDKIDNKNILAKIETTQNEFHINALHNNIKKYDKTMKKLRDSNDETKTNNRIRKIIDLYKKLKIFPKIFKNESLIFQKEIGSNLYKLVSSQNENNLIANNLLTFKFIDENFLSYQSVYNLKNSYNISLESIDIFFGKMSSNDFLNLLYELKKIFDNFNQEIISFLEKPSLHKDKQLDIIFKINGLILNIQRSLHVSVSNHCQSKRISNIIHNKLQKYINDLSILYDDFLMLVTKQFLNEWHALNLNQYMENILKFNYDIKIPQIQENHISKYDFSEIEDLESLSSPILCISADNKLICSVKKIKCDINPIFPSLTYDKPYSVNLLSFIDREILLSIENINDEQFGQCVKTNEKQSNKEPVQIIVVPPVIKNTEPVSLPIKGQLKIKTENVESISIPFEITLGIVPLKARLRCKQYKLSKEDNQKYFRLCCDKIYSGDQIDFELINYYIKTHEFNLAVELESLDENQSEKPKIKVYKQGFSLTMPQVAVPTHCRFDIYIKLSQEFENRIRCDFIIIPFIFIFELYDFCNKEFTSDRCEIVKISEPQILHFRVYSLYQIKQEGRISFNLPKEIIITEKKDDFPREIIINKKGIVKLDQLDITKPLMFEYKITNLDKNFLLYNRYSISFEIRGFQKSILIQFRHPRSIENSISLPKYISYNDNSNWKKLDDSDNHQVDKLHVIISPFSYSIKKEQFLSIDYHPCLRIFTQSKIQNHFFNYVQVTLNFNDKYGYINLNQFPDKKTIEEQNETENDTLKYKKPNKIIVSYYTIFGFDANNKNIWFPVFDIYPDFSDFKPLPYDSRSDNINRARNQINQMFTSVDTSIFIVRNIFYSDQNKIKQTNFAIFMAALNDKYIVKNIYFLIGFLPESIRSEFNDIISDIDNFKNDDMEFHRLFDVISHNLIIKFANVFYERYQKIKSTLFCLNLSITEDEINEQIKRVYQEFMTFNNEDYQQKRDDSMFSEIKNEIEGIEIDPLLEENMQNECFIISENQEPKPCKFSDNLGNLSFESKKIQNYSDDDEISENDDNDDSENDISGDVNIDTSLPSIQLPETNSIKSLSLFYTNCSQGASVLPTHIRNCIISKTNLNDSEIYFSQLLNIYSEITKESTVNKTILSSSINNFCDSFKDCLKRLKRAGINFAGLKLPLILGDSNYFQTIIGKPIVEDPVLPHFIWSTQKQILNELKDSNDDLYFEPGRIHIEESKNKPSQNQLLHINESRSDSMMHISRSTSNIPNSFINKDDGKTNFESIAFPFACNNNQEDDENDKEKNDDEPSFIADIVDSKQIEASPDEYDEHSTEITEKDIIKLVVEKINTIDANINLKFSKCGYFTIDNRYQLFDVKINHFPVKDLIDQSQYLVAKLISNVSDANCPFDLMSCNLLIDCCSIISMPNKLFNLMLLISFSYALSALEIPFSISIIADQHFRYLMKTYEEQLSPSVLQKVLDCLLIKRYRANIADTFNSAINLSKYQNRTQRAFFIFTNGLDENLALTQSWNESLLNDPNNSFGMIFTKSIDFDKELRSFIQKMWDNFINKTTMSVSITRLVAINTNYNPENLNSVFSAFADVLSRPKDINANELQESVIDKMPEFKDQYETFTAQSFSKIKKYFNYNFEGFNSLIYKNTTQNINTNGTNFEKYDANYYSQNKKTKITYSPVDENIKKQFDNFIHELLFTNRRMYGSFTETIFKPNKASTTVLSDIGTDFDITALILNLINPVPDPLIYLEEKGGLIQNYEVSIIIDSSFSCFSLLSMYHSYQTIRVLFSALGSVEIPCVDVIIATKDSPIVLCCEIPSMKAFDEKSSLWPSLFNCLLQNCSNSVSCKLESAIHAAFDLRSMRSVDSTSFMFVLSDGLYPNKQKEIIRNHVASCVKNGISMIGIGIGIYPSGMNDLFPQVIFSPDPNHLIHGIASFFDKDSNEKFDDKINVIVAGQPNPKHIMNINKQLIANESTPIFEKLKEKLSDTIVGLDAHSLVYNEEQQTNESGKTIINQTIKRKEMYIKDFFKGQKILIVMLYDNRINIKENPKIKIENLQDSPNGICVKKAVEFYGIEIKIVQNYKDAITELTRQSTRSKCDYYAVWVLSGLPYNFPLPDGGNQHLVGQFIDCLVYFWGKGGAVVLFSEGEPLTFQTNLFLEKIKFNDAPTYLRFGGCHQGGETLEPDLTGILNKPKTFNKSPNEYAKFQRAPLGHNLEKIYEGETISYAPNEKSQYYPFVPFMRDSDGGINALFYPSDSDQAKTGDIIVCGSYTNLFDSMTKEGTFRFIQNIAAWTMQYESRHLRMELAEKFLPDAVYCDIDESVIFEGFIPVPKEYNIPCLKLTTKKIPNTIFAIEYSTSVRGNSFFYNNLQSIMNLYYRDGDKIIAWGSSVYDVSKNDIDNYIKNKSGSYFHGPYPSSIAKKFITNNQEEIDRIKNTHLIIVTCGEIDIQSVYDAFSIIHQNNIQFKYVTAFVIGEKANDYVGIAFVRNCASTTYKITENGIKKILETDSEMFISFDMIDKIDLIEHFQSRFVALYNLIKKISNEPGKRKLLKEKIEKMRERIRSHYEYQIIPDEVEQKITALITICTGSADNILDSDIISAMNLK